MKYEFILEITTVILVVFIMLINFSEAAIPCPAEPLELNHNEEIKIKNSVVKLIVDPSKPSIIRCYDNAIVIKKDVFYTVIEVGDAQENILLNLISNCLNTKGNKLCTVPEKKCENEFKLNNDKIENITICYENKNIGALNISNSSILTFGCKFKFYESAKIEIQDTNLNIFPSKVPTQVNYQCKNIVRRFDVLTPTTIKITQESGEYKFTLKGENSIYRRFRNVIDFKSKGILYYSPDEDIIELKEGEININEAVIKGKNIKIGYFNGETIEELTRKYDVAIKDTDLIISKTANFDLLLGGKNIEIRNGTINSFTPSSDLKENRAITIYSKDKVIVECNELSCKTSDALKLTMAPYFAKQISIKIQEKNFFSPNVENRLDTYPSKIKIHEKEGTGGDYDHISDRITISPLHLVGTGLASEYVFVHEFMHAIWHKELTNEQRIAFDKDHEKYRKEYGFNLDKKIYGFAKFVTAINNFIWGEKFGEFKTDTIEGWAYTAQDIYINCYGSSGKVFPDYILKHYERIINKECLDKAREH